MSTLPLTPATVAADQRRLLVALADPTQDAVLLRYAASWTAGTLQEDTVCAGTTAQGRDLYVAPPRQVQAVRVPSGAHRAPQELLQCSAADGVDALAVGETAGRDLACDLVRRARSSVWFVPRDASPPPRRVLVPIDFSLAAADSLRVASLLARRSGAEEYLALHVYFNDLYLAGAWGDRAVRRAVWQQFEAFMKPIDTLGVRVTPLFREAVDVSRAIVVTAAAEQVNLIVLTARTSAALWLRQAGVAEQTVRSSTAPVLTLKHFGARRGFLNLIRETFQDRTGGLRCN